MMRPSFPLPPVGRGAIAAATLLIAVGVSAPRAGAQELRGTVRDSASRQPISTVVLILADSFGAPIIRGLTNERGEFRMQLPGAARRLQLLRIGFRPRVVLLPSGAGGVVTLDLTMRMIPTLLDPVEVTDSPNCPKRDDRAAAFALWDQARSALLAAVVARETERAVMKRLHFDRRMMQDGFTPVSQVVHVDSSSGARPFVATHPAAEFIERGFVDDSANVAVFNGPDADVMLDDAFPRGYCFQLAASDRARPQQIGLAFEAATHKRGRVDVEGAVWIDSTTRSLVEIVFRYVGIDRRFERYEPGGRVSFHTMADGTPIIDRWSIRPIGVPASSRLGMVAVSPGAMHESGGEVARARWDDGRTWAAPLGTLTGIVTRDRIPAGGQIVTLIGTDYAAVSDSTGRFTIADLIPGPYVVAVADTVLSPLEIVLKTSVSFTAARDSTTRVAFEAPTAEEYAAQMCSRRSRGAGRAVIVGRVLRPDGSPATGAQIDASLILASGMEPFTTEKADERGLFQICNVPLGMKVQIRAEGETRTAILSAADVLDATRSVEALRLVLHPTPRWTRWLTVSAGASCAGTRSLRGCAATHRSTPPFAPGRVRSPSVRRCRSGAGQDTSRRRRPAVLLHEYDAGACRDRPHAASRR